MAHLCINCNAPDVRRIDDTFTCRKCGYRWDVAHEQANATYLLSQGRPPAEPSEPTVEAPPETDLVPPQDEGVAGEGQDYLEWLAAMTKAELVALAAEHGVELDGDLRKADMVNTIAAVLPSASDDTHSENAG